MFGVLSFLYAIGAPLCSVFFHLIRNSYYFCRIPEEKWYLCFYPALPALQAGVRKKEESRLAKRTNDNPLNDVVAGIIYLKLGAKVVFLIDVGVMA